MRRSSRSNATDPTTMNYTVRDNERNQEIECYKTIFFGADSLNLWSSRLCLLPFEKGFALPIL